MAESVRNTALALVAVTSLHLLIRSIEKRNSSYGGTLSPATVGAPSTCAGDLHERTQPRSSPPADDLFFSERAVNYARPVNHATGGVTNSATGMPMDGLREMFEFATARGAVSEEACDRPDLGPAADDAGMMVRTDEVYPEQIGGAYAVVNAYENEGVGNGGGIGAGGVAAFDGWGDVATFEPCQTDGTNSQ